MVEKFPDDVLLDILIRLPNCESIIRCSSVCKRWRSLITRNSELFRRIISELNQPQFYTHLLGQHSTLTEGPEKISRAKYHELSFGRRSEPQITTFSETRLDFLPWPQEELEIRASFCDLLLVSLRNNNREYCVCNIFTKQAVRLPRAPINDTTRWGLVFKSKSCNERLRCNCDVQYKVVLIQSRSDRPRARIFCSETGHWTKVNLQDSWESEPKIKGSCWMGWIGVLDKFLLTFDPFESPGEQSGSIALPSDIFSRREFNSIITAFVGSVKGRLCLTQMTWAMREPRQFIKVWELNPSGDWTLEHDVELKARGDQGPLHMSMFAFHPNDGNAIFVHCGDNDVCVYNFAESSAEQVGRIPELHQDSIASVMNLSDCFTLHRPSTPTLIIPHLSNF